MLRKLRKVLFVNKALWFLGHRCTRRYSNCHALTSKDVTERLYFWRRSLTLEGLHTYQYQKCSWHLLERSTTIYPSGQLQVICWKGSHQNCWLGIQTLMPQDFRTFWLSGGKLSGCYSRSMMYTRAMAMNLIVCCRWNYIATRERDNAELCCVGEEYKRFHKGYAAGNIVLDEFHAKLAADCRDVYIDGVFSQKLQRKFRLCFLGLEGDLPAQARAFRVVRNFACVPHCMCPWCGANDTTTPYTDARPEALWRSTVSMERPWPIESPSPLVDIHGADRETFLSKDLFHMAQLGHVRTFCVNVLCYLVWRNHFATRPVSSIDIIFEKNASLRFGLVNRYIHRIQRTIVLQQEKMIRWNSVFFSVSRWNPVLFFSFPMKSDLWFFKLIL